LLFSDCSSNKEIRKLSSQLDCSKRIYLVWDDESNLAKSEKIGNHKDSYASYWKVKKLNHKEIFIKSLKEFNEKHEGEYIYTENRGFPSDSIIQVSVRLEKIVWDMGFSKMITDLHLVYTTPNKELSLMGTSNGFRGEKSFLKCFEDANLQFLI